MKSSESILTYFPIAYVIVISGLVGIFTHKFIDEYKESVILTAFLVNVLIHRNYDQEWIVKNKLIKIIWLCNIFAVYAFLTNIVHRMLFREYEHNNVGPGLVLSIVYEVVVFIFSYYYPSETGLILCHTVFLYFPVSRFWISNLSCFIISNTIYLFLMLSAITPFQICKSNIHLRPIIHTFQYLNVHHFALVVMPFHILFEFFYKDEIIQKIIKIDKDAWYDEQLDSMTTSEEYKREKRFKYSLSSTKDDMEDLDDLLNSSDDNEDENV